MRTISLLLFLLLTLGCENFGTAKKPRQVQELSYTIVDSIALFNDSMAFRFVNPEKISENKILAFQYPMLNLSLLDSTGQFVKEISRKGNLPGNFVSIFILPLWDDNGNIFVIEQGDVSRLSIFNKNLAFEKSIHLLKDEYFIPAILSSTEIYKSPYDKGIRIITSINSNVYIEHDKKYYEEGFGIADITINNSEVTSIQYRLPYKDMDYIKQALERDKKTWDSSTAYFKIWNNKLYVKFEFDNSVYVYNPDNFELEKEIILSPAYESKGYSTPFGNIYKGDINKSVEGSFRIRASNLYYYDINVKDGCLFILYRKPLPENRIPTNAAEEEDTQYTSVLHIYDLSNDKEYTLDLPEMLSDYTRIYPLDRETVLFTGDEKVSEDIYLYKFKLIY
ncbi:MAG TPA: hypothetical protein PKD70_15265 [Saprospiraceae bacterium]|nr:hypothetical protein [Saprospiraceae bacterium]HMP15237.1 hypothetical protein [Saprospiraceae bacterium]